MAHNFATANGCTWNEPTMVTSGNHVCADMMGCMADYPVKFCSFNGPHTPDPRDGNQMPSWQYQLVWNFFDQGGPRLRPVVVGAPRTSLAKVRALP